MQFMQKMDFLCTITATPELIAGRSICLKNGTAVGFPNNYSKNRLKGYFKSYSNTKLT